MRYHPLPTPASGEQVYTGHGNFDSIPYYTAEQMHAYVDAHRPPTVLPESVIVAGMEADCLGRPSIDDSTHVLSIWNAMQTALEKSWDE